MMGLKYLVLALVAISASEATNKIWKIGVTTATCDDCGMSNTFGALRMQVRKDYFDFWTFSSILKRTLNMDTIYHVYFLLPDL